VRRAAAVAVAVALAGCGGSDEPDAERPPSAEAVELARRCDLGRPHGGVPPATLLPARLLPPTALFFRWDGEGLAARARIVFRDDLLGAQRSVEANAATLGLPVLFRETEVFDAELDVQSGPEVIRFAFSVVDECPDVTVAAVRKLAGPG